MNSLLHWLTTPEWTQGVKALLHTLWQGAVVAVLLGLVLRNVTRPIVRYRCSMAALMSVLLSGIVTWVAMLPEHTPASHSSTGNPASFISTPQEVLESAAVRATDVTIIQAAASETRAAPPWTAWLALCWIAGAALMLIRAGVQVAGAEKLRRSARPLDSPIFADMLSEARGALRLVRRVRLAVTDKLTSPAVVGVLVPTLIFPLSLTTTLTPEQIRFILLHELAHIRRGDYLANLFQLFAEALLFFNPAVWWISHQIRREREACCDALATELSGAPADYARTLVRVAENVLTPASSAAPAFGDERHAPLLERVQRLLVPGYRPALRLTWRAMLASLLIGTALLTLTAVGTRVTMAAAARLLTPEQRIAEIEKKMVEYGQPITAASPANSERFTVTARVRTGDGEPLPRQRVVVLHSIGPRSSGFYAMSLNSDGVAKGACNPGRIWVEVDVEGYAPAVSGPHDPGFAPILNAGEIVIDRGFETAIQLRDSITGNPVTNADIHARFWMRETGHNFQRSYQGKPDDAGQMKLSACADHPLVVQVNAPGYELHEQRFEQLKPGQTLEVRLFPGTPVSGQIVDRASGQGLADATIRVIHERGPTDKHHPWNDPMQLIAQTDATGRFITRRLRRDTKYWLGIGAPGHESVIVQRTPAGSGELRVELGPELVVSGRILANAETLEQLDSRRALYRSWSEVVENSSYGDGEHVPLTITKNDATFEFTNRVAGPVRLSINGREFSRHIDAPVNDWALDLSQTEVAAQTNLPKREVIFRFRNPSGVLPRGTVSVNIPENLDPDHRTGRSEIREFDNGEVRVEIPIGGWTGVEPRNAIGFWFGRVTVETVTNGEGPLVIDVPLIPAGAIYARARNADGTPAGGLFFSVHEVRRSPRRAAGSSLDGSGDSLSGSTPRSWVSGPLPLDGTYQLIGWRGNSFCASDPVRLTEETPIAEVELQFKPTRVLSGRVLDADGNPIRGAELDCSFTYREGHGFGLKPVFTDERGEFKLENASPELGQYSVAVSAPGMRSELFTLNPDRPMELRLEPGSTLSGQVIEAGTGYVIPNAEVRAWTYDPKGRFPQQKVRTDSEGEFTFTTLADTDYRLFVNGGNPADTRVEKKFRPGTAPVVLEVKPYPGGGLNPKAPEQHARTSSSPSMPSGLERPSSGPYSNPIRLEFVGLIDSGPFTIGTASGESSTQWPLPSPSFLVRSAQIPTAPDVPWQATSIVTNQESRNAISKNLETSPHILEFKFQLSQVLGKPGLPTDAEIYRQAFLNYFRSGGIELSPPKGVRVENETITVSAAYSDFLRPGRGTARELQAPERLRPQSELHPAGAPAADPGSEQLQIRAFSVDPDAFIVHFGLANATNSPGFIREFFLKHGVDLDPASGKSVFMSTSGGLLVRATPEDLRRIEALLEKADLPKAGPPAAVQKTLRKLQEIRFSHLAFEQTPLSEVLRTLTAQSKQFDPEGEGVQFLLDFSRTANWAQDPRAPAAERTQSANEAYLAKVNVSLSVRDADLNAILRAVSTGASRPISYMVRRDGTVAFNAGRQVTQVDGLPRVTAQRENNTASQSGSQLHIRRFMLDPNTFYMNLEKEAGRKWDPSAPDSATILVKTLVDYWKKSGVDLASNTNKSLYWNVREGALLVRATLEELDRIERVVARLNTNPVQINIRSQFFELRESEALQLHAKWFPASDSTGLVNTVLSSDRTRELLRDLAKARLMEAQVTTLDQHQAQIQDVDLRAVAFPGTNGVVTARSVPVGPILDVIPTRVTTNLIQLVATMSVTEFLGYADPGPFVVQGEGTNGPRTAKLPLPHFRVGHASVTNIVPDGHTLFISGLPASATDRTQDKTSVLGDLPVPGRLFRTDQNTSQTNIIFVLVTPTLVDAAGNRLNAGR